MIARRQTRQVHVGSVAVGGDAPVSVQTMTKTDTRDIDATAEQIREAATLGCDIVRVAVVDESAARAIGELNKAVTVPIVADVHFDHRLAIASAEAGAAGLRINPGNIGAREKVGEVVQAAKDRAIPIRIGVNSGSLEKDLVKRYGEGDPEALVESALRHVGLVESFGYDQIKISVKSSSVPRTLEAYRRLSRATDYPLHVGVTEAGTFLAGTVRSSVALGVLLGEGIGDTIRVSLTDRPAAEVRVGLEILRSLGLREPGPNVISCPTCGRIEVDVVALATRIETELERFYAENTDAPRPVVAVMGCMVNGPGEAREADIAVAGGQGKFALYVRGRYVATVVESEAEKAVLDRVREWSGE
jgi:(E)-4-hydroxy-3-methylbut-2-enyl-diphosphate synthase